MCDANDNPPSSTPSCIQGNSQCSTGFTDKNSKDYKICRNNCFTDEKTSCNNIGKYLILSYDSSSNKYVPKNSLIYLDRRNFYLDPDEILIIQIPNDENGRPYWAFNQFGNNEWNFIKSGSNFWVTRVDLDPTILSTRWNAAAGSLYEMDVNTVDGFPLSQYSINFDSSAVDGINTNYFITYSIKKQGDTSDNFIMDSSYCFAPLDKCPQQGIDAESNKCNAPGHWKNPSEIDIGKVDENAMNRKWGIWDADYLNNQCNNNIEKNNYAGCPSDVNKACCRVWWSSNQLAAKPWVEFMWGLDENNNIDATNMCQAYNWAYDERTLIINDNYKMNDHGADNTYYIPNDQSSGVCNEPNNFSFTNTINHPPGNYVKFNGTNYCPADNHINNPLRDVVIDKNKTNTWGSLNIGIIDITNYK